MDSAVRCSACSEWVYFYNCVNKQQITQREGCRILATMLIVMSGFDKGSVVTVARRSRDKKSYTQIWRTRRPQQESLVWLKTSKVWLMYTNVYKPLLSVIIGDGSVGKTCFLYRFCESKYTEDYIPTIFENYNKDYTVNGEQHILRWGFDF